MLLPVKGGPKLFLLRHLLPSLWQPAGVDQTLIVGFVFGFMQLLSVGQTLMIVGFVFGLMQLLSVDQALICVWIKVLISKT